jgi:hypothetical protein
MLGMLSFSYTQWRDYTVRKYEIEQLDLEIGLRLRAVESRATGENTIRYSNLVNTGDVLDGSVKSSFCVRKPLFNEYEGKGISTLLWQLYLIIPQS